MNRARVIWTAARAEAVRELLVVELRYVPVLPAEHSCTSRCVEDTVAVSPGEAERGHEVVIVEDRVMDNPSFEFVQFHAMPGYSEALGNQIQASAFVHVVVSVRIHGARHTHRDEAAPVGIRAPGRSLLRVVRVVEEIFVWRGVPRQRIERREQLSGAEYRNLCVPCYASLSSSLDGHLSAKEF